jgi:hypothetical protein
MKLTDGTAFGSSPWPKALGGPRNANATLVNFRGTGKTLWSAPIRCVPMAVGEDGCLFAMGGNTLYAVEPGGTVRWHRTANERFGEPAALADGSLLVVEDGRLVARDQRTGDERWSHDYGYYWRHLAPEVTLDGSIVLIRGVSNSWEDLELCLLGPGPEVLWTFPLSWGPHRVSILEGVIAVTDKSYLLGLDYEGRLLWIANRHGFVAGSDATGVERSIEYEEFTTPPMRLESSKIAAGYKWYSGQDVLIFDTASRSVSLSGYPRNLRSPVTLILSSPPRLAGNLLQNLYSGEITGQMVFEKKLQWGILNIVSDACGNIVASTSVDRDYWEKYLEPYSLHDRCGLTGLDPAGNELFRWVAPGPMSEALAVGKEGEIYCASEGRLWAVG